jgi:hypothetical protein
MRIYAAMLFSGCMMAGCYNYAPLATPAPEPGTSLAVTLTDSGSSTLARYLGPDAFIVRGRYLGTDEGTLLLSVTEIERRRGWQDSWSGERVALPNGLIKSLDVRRFARGRSYLLAGAGVVGIVATVGAFALSGGGTPPAGAGGPPVKQ